ncbi:hypothetical protein PALI_a2605 [Pseudoalteromonas aliena SW19]|uniref:Uncharacterized protein n=1 Tax=Pseudoalteromonas aliena SW19 TaxID=1314866 RepID=A0ABR9E427_9GAMM|nr:hypothetical protein [Pseudoalteromonas aliena SW19]
MYNPPIISILFIIKNDVSKEKIVSYKGLLFRYLYHSSGDIA